MKNVLITGGAGFIGSNFIHYLTKQNPALHIINLDALTYAGNIENLKTLKDNCNYQFIQGNICDQSLVRTLFLEQAIDTVVHFAAESHVDRSISGPLPFIETNVVGTATLLDIARQTWLTQQAMDNHAFRFHHVSTDEVFGSLKPGDAPFTENTPYAPNSPYAASKAASDHIVRSYYHTYGLPITISNCSNNYGPYQFPEKLIPLIILNAITGKPLPIYGDGQQIRDWLFVGDHCSAIYQILEKGNIGETYNIGGNNQPTNLEIVNSICQILDEIMPRKDKISYVRQLKYVQDRPGHDRRYAMDTIKIYKSLGWQPQEKIDTGLKKTIEWYLSNRDWLVSIQNRQGYQDWVDVHYKGPKGIKE